MYIERPAYIARIVKAFRSHPVTAILGPRQCGKTTLSRSYIELKKPNDVVYFFDLEDPTDLSFLKNPKTELEPLQGIIIIDEIQRVPDLFPIIRVLVDQPHSNRKFL